MLAAIRGSAFLALVALISAGVAATSASGGRFSPCVPDGTKVTLHHGHLVVFSGPGKTKQIRACWGSRGRPVEVGLRRKCDPGLGCEQAPLMTTAGACTAANDVKTLSGSTFYQLYVVDVKRRKFWNFRSSQPTPGSLNVGVGPPTDVVMKPGCAVAWIASNQYGGPSEVRRDDSTGRVVLAKGTDIDLHSLELSGSTVSWTQAGTRHHARLAGRPRGGLAA